MKAFVKDFLSTTFKEIAQIIIIIIIIIFLATICCNPMFLSPPGRKGFQLSTCLISVDWEEI